MHTEMYDGEKTQLAHERVWGLRDNGENEDENILWSKEVICQMDETQLFKEKLFDRMKAAGFCGDIDDQNAAFTFLKKCCDDAGVSILPQTLINWVCSGKVKADSRGRASIYKLCFALKMNMRETKAFFHKALFARPFNFKDLYESVCFFCLNTNKSYQDVERLVQKIQSLPLQQTNASFERTVMIGNDIEKFRTEDQLIGYWLQNSTGFTRQKQTATEEAKSLLQRCYNAAEIFYAADGWKYSNPDELLGAMFGFNPRVVKDGKKIYSKAFSESDFPPAIKRNFPQREQIKNILGNDASDDVLRKALIAFSFFEFYATNPDADFEDFEEMLNARLQKCGYIGAYWRNPYDWMFAHCATQADPLCALHELVEEFVVKPAIKRQTDII